MKMTRVTQFKAGDIIHYQGSRFLIRENAAEEILHRPQAGHLEAAAGPSPVATALGDWLDGDFTGYAGTRYFRFAGTWTNGLYRVEERT